ncbi:MAG: histidine--tRNA ligase [Candidatus Paceibacterota bacterium]
MPSKINQDPPKRINKRRLLQTPRGMKDILPEDFLYYDYLIEIAKKTLEFYNFRRCEPPVLEKAELYNKGIGSDTDIVEKEMYTLKTKEEGEFLALRPEYTAGIARAYVENGMFNWPQPVKLYSIGPIFRHEKPQAGRYRQFYQLNIESIGDSSPALDIEVILASRAFLENLGFNQSNLEIRINSIGCNKCRSTYIRALVKYYRQYQRDVCKDCQKRLKTNLLRVLDCKNSKCVAIKDKAPSFLDYLCGECKDHFKNVLDILDSVGVSYVLDKSLVRGLDYYSRTVFEIRKKDKETNLALAGGGRYDYLVKLLGGLDRPAVGVAFGIERLIEELKVIKKKLEFPRPKVFLIQIGDAAKKQAFVLLEKLRKANILTEANLEKNNINSQIKNADRVNAPYALILGQQEVLDGMIILKDMASGLQETIPFDKIIEELKKRL